MKSAFKNKNGEVASVVHEEGRLGLGCDVEPEPLSNHAKPVSSVLFVHPVFDHPRCMLQWRPPYLHIKSIAEVVLINSTCDQIQRVCQHFAIHVRFLLSHTAYLDNGLVLHHVLEVGVDLGHGSFPF